MPAERWREEARLLRRYGDERGAVVCELHAAELEAWLRERDAEPLTLEAAAQESGFSYSSIQKRVAAGELENVGSKGRPRVRRGDLPKKVRREEPDIVDILRARSA